MLLSTLVILIVGLVAYIHWLQGLLSGFISAILAIVSAGIALSFYETMATTLSGGKFNDQAHGICLIAAFALSYLVLRVIFDMLVPGNIRVPVMADKVGGAIGGVVAGIFGCGIVVIAMQYMPFGPSIAGYTRYSVNDEHEVNLIAKANATGITRTIIDELKTPDLNTDKSSLVLPVDDITVGIVSHLSDGGSLAGLRPLKSVHPDLMQELFGQRLATQVGVKRTASNKAGEQVRVEKIYVLPGKLPQVASEIQDIRKVEYKTPLVPSSADKELIAVTIMFLRNAADDDGVVRLGPAAIRLVARDAAGEWKNFFPIGTVQNGQAWMNRVDDFIFFNVKDADGGAHFIFEIDKSLLKKADKAGTLKIANPDEVFIEVKRMVQYPMGGISIVQGLPPNDRKYRPMRKEKLFIEPAVKTEVVDNNQQQTMPDNPNPTNPDNPNPNPNPDNPPQPEDNGWKDAPFEKPVIAVSDKLPVAISVGSPDAEIDPVVATAFNGVVKGRKFATLETMVAEAGTNVKELPKGGNTIQQFMVPAGKRMVQVTLNLKSSVQDWGWTGNLGDVAVFDGTNHYKYRGAFALVTIGGAQRLLARYEPESDAPGMSGSEGKVTSVTLIYLLPTGAKARELRYQEKPKGLPLEK